MICSTLTTRRASFSCRPGRLPIPRTVRASPAPADPHAERMRLNFVRTLCALAQDRDFFITQRRRFPAIDTILTTPAVCSTRTRLVVIDVNKDIAGKQWRPLTALCGRSSVHFARTMGAETRDPCFPVDVPPRTHAAPACTLPTSAARSLLPCRRRKTFFCRRARLRHSQSQYSGFLTQHLGSGWSVTRLVSATEGSATVECQYENYARWSAELRQLPATKSIRSSCKNFFASKWRAEQSNFWKLNGNRPTCGRRCAPNSKRIP